MAESEPASRSPDSKSVSFFPDSRGRGLLSGLYCTDISFFFLAAKGVSSISKQEAASQLKVLRSGSWAEWRKEMELGERARHHLSQNNAFAQNETGSTPPAPPSQGPDCSSGCVCFPVPGDGSVALPVNVAGEPIPPNLRHAGSTPLPKAVRPAQR